MTLQPSVKRCWIISKRIPLMHLAKLYVRNLSVFLEISWKRIYNTKYFFILCLLLFLKTVDVAVLEHNMLACSLLYNNITFVQLGTLLNVSSREAEHTCSKMITGSQMKGMIDQVDGILYFGDYNGEAIVPLLKFDKEINYICTEMNELAFEIIDGEGNAMEFEK